MLHLETKSADFLDEIALVKSDVGLLVDGKFPVSRHALQYGTVLQLNAWVGAEQVIDRYLAFEGTQLAAANPSLNLAPADPSQSCRSGAASCFDSLKRG
jgi:hypothetical protein